MHSDIERVLITEEEILQRLDELAAEVLVGFACDELVVVALLKGALLFVADLTRRLPVKLSIECLNVASYHGGLASCGEVKFLDAHLPAVVGKKVLVMDDILDTGLTMREVVKWLHDAGACEVKTCVLLEKNKSRDEMEHADYTAFSIEDEFVVGYGLDFDGRYRNLPYVGVLRR